MVCFEFLPKLFPISGDEDCPGCRFIEPTSVYDRFSPGLYKPLQDSIFLEWDELALKGWIGALAQFVHGTGNYYIRLAPDKWAGRVFFHRLYMTVDSEEHHIFNVFGPNSLARLQKAFDNFSPAINAFYREPQAEVCRLLPIGYVSFCRMYRDLHSLIKLAGPSSYMLSYIRPDSRMD